MTGFTAATRDGRDDEFADDREDVFSSGSSASVGFESADTLAVEHWGGRRNWKTRTGSDPRGGE